MSLRGFLPVVVVSACSVGAASSAILVSGSTTAWTPVTYANPNQSDPSNDEQANSRDLDIVGNATHPSFYTQFDGGGTPSLIDGEIGFRIRVAGDSNPGGFKGTAWIGMDVDSSGSIDLFAGVIDGTTIGFYRAGGDANISPNTTSVSTNNAYYTVGASSSNYSFMQVNSTNNPIANLNINLDNGSGGGATHNDYFLTVALPFDRLVLAVNSLNIAGLVFNESTPLRFVVATSNQSNSINGDLNGVPLNYNVNSTWSALGAFTGTTSANGLIPEPSGALLALGSLGFLGLLRRR